MSDPAGQPPQKSPSSKAPNSLRALQIVSGAITLALAALVLLFPAVAVFVIVFWLSISLLFGGIDDMIVGIGAEVEESYLEVTGAISFIRKKEQKAAVM
jgi:uncharacterized membrane protein HdeD (DUF308 family)